MNENTDDSRWNELVPEAFAEASDPMVRVLLGKMLVVRLNQIGTNDDLLSFELIGGRVIRANRKEGLVISLVGTRQGEEFFLPLVPEAYLMLDPGDYALTCGMVVRNPDFSAAFDIYAQIN